MAQVQLLLVKNSKALIFCDSGGATKVKAQPLTLHWSKVATLTSLRREVQKCMFALFLSKESLITVKRSATS